MYIRISDPGIGRHPPRVAMALRTSRWDFHTVRDGIDPGDYRFLLWLIGVVYTYIWKDFRSGDGILSSLGGDGSTNLGLEFTHRAGRCRPGGSPLSSPVRPSCRCTGGFLIPVLPGCRWLHEHLFAVSRTKFQLNMFGELDLVRTRYVLNSATNCSMLR